LREAQWSGIRVQPRPKTVSRSACRQKIGSFCIIYRIPVCEQAVYIVFCPVETRPLGPLSDGTAPRSSSRSSDSEAAARHRVIEHQFHPGRASGQAQAATRFVERRGGGFFGGGRSKSAGASARATASGSLSMTINRTRAAPSGWRRFCSHRATWMARYRSVRRMRSDSFSVCSKWPARRGGTEYASLGFRIGFALGDRLGRLRCVDQPLVIWRPSPHYITRRLDLAALLDSDLARGLLVWRPSGLWVGSCRYASRVIPKALRSSPGRRLREMPNV
jgi:hypothetical protein